MKKSNLTSILLLFCLFLIVSVSVVSAGMVAPKCDARINSSSYFENYINNTAFKSLHPSFDNWRLIYGIFDNENSCINENEKAVLRRYFILPSDLSRYDISYSFTLYLVVNWDKSAYFAHNETPERLIEFAESLLETKEFLKKYELRNKSSIGPSSFAPHTGEVSPLNVYYKGQNGSSLVISSKGLEYADLSIHENYSNFPFVSTIRELAENALIKVDCSLNESPSSYIRYFPSKNEKFVYTILNINCQSNNRYAIFSIDPTDEKYDLWLENKGKIDGGELNLQQMQKLGISSNPPAQENSSSNNFTWLIPIILLTLAVIIFRMFKNYWIDKIFLKIFAVLMLTYIGFSMTYYQSADMQHSFETSLSNAPSPFAILDGFIYTVTDSLGNHFNLYAAIGRFPFLLVSFFVNVSIVFGLSLLVYYLKNKYGIENLIKFSFFRISLAIFLFYISFHIDSALNSCSGRGPFCEAYLGFPSPVMLITDFGPPVFLSAVIFNIWFWFLISCAFVVCIQIINKNRYKILSSL